MEHSDITIDLTGETIPYARGFQNCVGSCHAYLALREDYREHLRKVQKEIGFRYIRFHGILHDWVGIYTGRKGEYNFQNFDKIIDFLMDTGIKPFLELSFMPNALASGKKFIFHYAANITPPADYELWNDLIRNLVLHCIARYGLQEVLTWRFEVWNEPDLSVFWSGSRDEYFKLYKNTALTIKQINDGLMVGGPATSGNKWIREIIDFCLAENAALDFFSTHMYCTNSALDLDGSFVNTFMGQEKMQEMAKDVVNIVRNSPFRDREIHYTEWNVSPVLTDTFGKDSVYTAAFVLQTIRDIGALVDSYAFWAFSDIFEETGISPLPFSGKFGMVNIHGITKPVYHAFKYLAHLYDREIVTSNRQLLVTRDNPGNVRLLAWNLPGVQQAFFDGRAWILHPRARKERVVLTGLSCRYRIRMYRVDDKSGNALGAWQEMGSPQYPDQGQMAELHKKAEPVLISDNVVNCAGSLELEHALDGCAFVFYDLQKI